MRVTSKFLMATTALALMVGYGAHAADEAKKKTAAPKKIVSKVVEVPPAVNPAVPPIMPPANGQIPIGGMGQPPIGQMGGMPMGQPPQQPPQMLPPGYHPQSGQIIMFTPPAGATMTSGSGMVMAAEGAYYYGNAMKSMHENMMMVRPSGNVDIDFVQGMLPHHQGAVDMAKIVLEKGKDPEIKKLAEKILKNQETEIQIMSDWLGKRLVKKPETN